MCIWIILGIDGNSIVSVYFCPTFYRWTHGWLTIDCRLLFNSSNKVDANNTFVYKYVLDVLTYKSTKSAPIIEVKKNALDKETYQQGISTKVFKLNSSFSEYGTVNYYLKDEDCIQKR